MAESVPLRSALRIHVVEVVVGDVLVEHLDFVLEDFAAEGGLLGAVEWEADGNNGLEIIRIRVF
jgi:hypothetical protein